MSYPQRSATLILLRKQILELIDTHCEAAPPSFRIGMRAMTNEIFVLLAEHERAPLGLLYGFADELARASSSETSFIEGEALRLHLRHVISKAVGEMDTVPRLHSDGAGSSSAAVAAMRLLH